MIVALELMLGTAVFAQPVDTRPPADSSSKDKDKDDSAKISIVGSSAELMGAEGTGVTSSAAPLALEHPIDPDTYICGPGDVLELNFWGQQNFRLRIAIDLEGRTFISKVGFVPVAGKTLTIVRAEIKKRVRADYPGLQFDLTLISPRSFLVHVVDYVKLPGTYPAHATDRVSSVLSKSTITGSRRRIAIKHRDGTTTAADLVKYELTGDTANNPTLLDGDIISVPAPEIVVTITGAVRRPGAYELVASKDVNELLGLAGGLKTEVTRTLPIRVARRDANQHESFIEVPFSADGAAGNTTLTDDDRVTVNGSDALQRSVLVIGAITGADSLDQTTTSKRLPFIEGDTVRSMIERAGGIRASGDLARSYISRPKADGPAEVIPVDLDALLVRRDFKADKKIAMGDTLVIPPAQFSVLVEGAVRRPGLYTYNPTFGFDQYIARAGGRTRLARDLDETTLVDANGFAHGYGSNTKPAPGDAILVPERTFSSPEVVQIIIACAGLVISGVAISIAASR